MLSALIIKQNAALMVAMWLSLPPRVHAQGTEDERLTLSNFVAKVRRHSSTAADASTKNKSLREKLGRKKASLDMVSAW